ncbi:hypothetical protein KCP69_21690 [Salmonella enterica subsp. enterica]|nr:hypothetical protein KCP69_21690 [Salmonella enterica subsp. enterica]
MAGANRFAHSAGAPLARLTKRTTAASVRPGLIMLVSTVGSFWRWGCLHHAGLIVLPAPGAASAGFSAVASAITIHPAAKPRRRKICWANEWFRDRAQKRVTGGDKTLAGAALLKRSGAMMTLRRFRCFE